MDDAWPPTRASQAADGQQQRQSATERAAASPPPASESAHSKRGASLSSDSELPVSTDDDRNDTVSALHPVRGVKRPRKSAYTARREETELLLREVAELESRALKLTERAAGRLSEKQLLNAILYDARRSQQLSLAVAKSAISGASHPSYADPLHTFIHLGKNWCERRKTLLAMKETRIRNALEYIQVRSQLLDPLKPHSAEERFENANGDYCCARFDLIQFAGVESVQQVYDSLLFYLLNMEITVSERTGHITVREDYDNVDKSLSNYRLQSIQFGVNVETNIVMFAKFFENGLELISNGRAPCGVVVGDFVDDDELNPFSPKERMRKDVSLAIVLTPHMRKKTNYNHGGDRGDAEEELVVVMARAKFLKLHKAEFAISPQARQELRENMCWGPVMVKTISELLHPEFVVPIVHEDANEQESASC